MSEGNVKDLPLRLQAVHVNPYKKLGLERDSTDINKIREVFRKSCIALIPHFVGFGKPRLQADQLNYAYNLVRGTIKGTPEEIKNSIETSPFFDFKPEYILPILQPLQKDRDEALAVYRGFQMLTVGSISYVVTTDSDSWFPIPVVQYVFDVNYVLRRHKIQRTYKAFEELYSELEKELLILPVLPTVVFDNAHLGSELALFLMRIHTTLANRGLYSPRLMAFLDIDTEKVQTEEEGAIVKLLDTMVKPSDTVWYMVDEKWLRKWRTFVMGRGPRRYFPPGKVDNQDLVDKLNSGRKDLKLGVDYRCVNYNVWRFFELVHGGGPIISRVEEEIYSRMGLSLHQAQIRIAVRMRIYLAKKRRDELYMIKLSTCQVAKSVMIGAARSVMKIKTEEMLRQHNKVRVNIALKEAAKFTQSVWRKKKQYVVLENLEAKKVEQELFRKVKNVSRDVPVSSNDGVVIEDLHPIVKMGSTNTYSRTITETQGGVIPFSLTKRPGQEEAIISETKERSLYILMSKLLSINSYPTDMISYDAIVQKLSTATFPIDLVFEKPLAPASIPTLPDLIKMSDEPLIRYNSFKIMMSHGIYVVKHSKMSSHLCTIRLDTRDLYYTGKYNSSIPEEEQWRKTSLFSLKFILNGHQSESVKGKIGFLNADQCFEIVTDSRNYLFEVPTRSKLLQLLAADDKARQDAWSILHNPSPEQLHQYIEQTGSIRAVENGRCIYSTDAYRFIKTNPDFIASQNSEHQQVVRREASQRQSANTREENYVSAEGRRASEQESESEAAIRCCNVLVACMKDVVLEVRGSQVFVDRQGIPVRRAKPKVTLRKIDP